MAADELSTNDTPVQDTNDTPDVPQTFNINGRNYSQEDLTQLVELGERGRELETKFDTKFDKLMPAFTNSRQELKELREKYEALEAERNNAPSNNENDEFSNPDAVRNAQIAAQKLGLLTKSDIDNYLNKNFEQLYNTQRGKEKLLEEATSLSKKYDGKNGMPKFEPVDVLEFMQKSGANDLEAAYKVMHLDQIQQQRELDISSGKKPNIYTNDVSTAGNKQPEPIKVTKDNLGPLLEQALNNEI